MFEIVRFEEHLEHETEHVVDAKRNIWLADIWTNQSAFLLNLSVIYKIYTYKIFILI